MQQTPLMKLLHLLLLISIPVLLHAQSNGKPLFRVLRMFGEFSYSKTQLSAELAAAKNRKEALDIIRSKKKSLGTITIAVSQGANTYYWYPLMDGKIQETEDDHIVLQSRNSTSLNFYQLSDFKTLFRDTLVLLDTLSVKLYLHNDNYPDDKFVILSRCNNGPDITTPIPISGERLLIIPGLVRDCRDISIINLENPDRTLAVCRLRFLTNTEKDDLLGLAKDIQQDQPAMPTKEKAALLENYIQMKYGAVYFPQLVQFLEKK